MQKQHILKENRHYESEDRVTGKYLALFSLIAWATPASSIRYNNILNVARIADTLRPNAGGEAADGSKCYVRVATAKAIAHACTRCFT